MKFGILTCALLLIVTGALAKTPLFSRTKVKKTIKVAVIDTGADLEDPRLKYYICGSKDFTGDGIKDVEGHGTHVLGSIIKYAGDSNFCLIVIKFYRLGMSSQVSYNAYLNALKYAFQQHPDIINVSAGGENWSEDELNIIQYNPKIRVIAAVGNDSKNFEKEDFRYYPACFVMPNVIGVASVDKRGKISGFSNYGKPCADKYEVGENVRSYAIGSGTTVMSGTSMATAIVTGKLIREMSR